MSGVRVPDGVPSVGVFNDEGPPVPIPNTEVKLISAEDTCLETDRKNRSMPTQKTSDRNVWGFLILFSGRAGKSRHEDAFLLKSVTDEITAVVCRGRERV